MTRNLLLLVHLAAVAAWLGANLVQFVVAPRFRRRGTVEARAWSDTARFLGRRYYNVAGVLVGASGVLLVLDGDWGWHGFVLVGIAMVVIGATLGVAVFDPLLRQEASALERGDDEAAARAQHDVVSVALLDTALLLVTMLAMIDRWHA
jgi:hypothetical protein